MNFLSPAALVLAAALTVPPLVLLYFLKLRRQEVVVPSTFFWKRAVEDLQVNAPFQRLRRNLLLLLQLIVLLLAAVALGQPLITADERMGKSLIVMLDRSASMNVVEPDGRTRLQRAQAEALRLVAEIGKEYERGMVIAFSDRAQMMTPFTASPAMLERAIEAVVPSDGLSRLREAVALATAHTQSELVGRDAPPGSPVSSAPPVEVVLLSDGRIADAATVSLERMAMKFVNVAVSDDNAAIVSLSAGRYYDRPEILNVLAVVQNFGRQPREVDVELLIEGRHQDIQTIALGAGMAGPEEQNFNLQRSRAVVSFDEVEFADRGVVEVRLVQPDQLPVDNRALAVIPAPRHIQVLLVTPGNILLQRVLASLPLSLTVMDPQAYGDAPEEQLMEGDRSSFGVVIFDNCTTDRLPTGSYVFLGQVPQLEGFAQGEAVEFDTVFNWDETHPIMRHVVPENIHIMRYRGLLLPSNAEALIDATQGTVVSLVNHGGSRYLIAAFSLLNESGTSLNTTWLARLHFVYFMYNAVQYLSGNLDVQIDAQTRPGDALAIRATEKDAQVNVQRPDGQVETALVSGLQMAHYGRTDQVGIYRAWPTVEGETRYAVNLFDDVESRIQPNSEFVIGGDALPAEDAVRRANVPVWPWLMLAAIGFLFLEWAVYSRRVWV